MNDAKNALSRLSSTYDDDEATSAVEALVRLGRASVGPISELLTVAALKDKGCDPGERIYYLAKALREIGDPAALPHLLRFYNELDAHATAMGTRNYDYKLSELLKAAKALSPQRCASIPAIVHGDDGIANRADVRAAVAQVLATA